jgi:hypothetical protein
MNTAVQPSRRPFDTNKATRLDYVPAAKTDLRSQWASFFVEHAKPETQESYQADQIAEHAARKIPGNY